MTDKLTKNIYAAVVHQYARMSDADIQPKTIMITANKPYNSSTPVIEYSIGSGYDGDQCKGGDLDSVITEYMRRHGWNEQHKPMVLIENSSSSDGDTGEDVIGLRPPLS